MVNILSLDWDYFIDVTEEQRATMFPETGTEEIDLKTQAIIWMARYASNPQLQNVSIIENQIEALTDIIYDYSKENTKFFVAESHKEISDILLECKKADEDIYLYNVDFHHDCFNTSKEEIAHGDWIKIVINETGDKEIHCGNWLRHFRNIGIINEATWIKRNDSEEPPAGIIDRILSDVKQLDNYLADGIDYIFFCRSGMWTPPHLDNEFVSAVYALADLIGFQDPVGIDEMYYRWTDTFQKEIKKLKESLGIVLKIS